MAAPKQRPQRCDLYLPGHVPHWIQARKGAGDRASYGRLVEINDGAITVAYLDRTALYRNHDTRPLERVAPIGTKVRVSERYYLLGVDLPDHTCKVFSIALDDAQWTPCSYLPLTDVTPEALAERLETRGGFSVPGESVTGWTK